MDNVRIINISKDQKHSLLQTKWPLGASKENIDFDQFLAFETNLHTINVFIFYCESNKLSMILKQIESKAKISNAQFIFVIENLENIEKNSPISQLELLPHSIIVEEAISHRNFSLLIKQIIYLDYYRKTIKEFAVESRSNTENFDHILSLAQSEIKQVKSESKALSSLMEYAENIQKSDALIAHAFEVTSEWKDREMRLLKEQLEMREKLSDYKDKELMDSHETLIATKSNLELSHKENMEREKVIVALGRLRSLSDHELLDLYNENNELKKKMSLQLEDT